MYRSAASVGTARIARDILLRMPSRALRVLRIVLSVRVSRPVVWLRVSHIGRATPALRAAYRFCVGRHGAMNPAGKVRCNIMAIAKGYSCVSQPLFDYKVPCLGLVSDVL